MLFQSRSASKRVGRGKGPNAAPRSRGVVAEPLEERLLMAIARASGGSGYSGTLSTNPTIKQQQLICDPAEPRSGSTSVLYDASLVTLRGAQYGPGYVPLDIIGAAPPPPPPGAVGGTSPVFGFVEVQVTPTVRRLQGLQSFLDQPSGPETGYVQILYQLNGTAGQLSPPQGFTIRDEAGVDGVDTHALLFALRPGVPDNAAPQYRVFAAPEGTHSNNFGDFLQVNDGSGTILRPDQIAPADVFTNPTDGSLAGMAFRDVNADGAFNGADTFLPGATVYLDANGNGAADAGESSQVTDEEGHYLFDNLRPGPYQVREVTPAGYLSPVTAPAGGVYRVNVVAGRRERNLDFGNMPGAAASGVVFNDADGNGVHNRNESGMPNVVVYADLNNNGRRDTGEPSDTSSRGGIFGIGAGNWSIGGLRAGTYTFREVVPTDYVQTAPDRPGSYTVTLATGQTVTGMSFGNYMPPPRVTGVFVSGPAWNATFKTGLRTLGDPSAGFRVNPSPPRDLPWVDPNQISIRFDKPVNVDMADLTATALNRRIAYPFSGFTYDAATRTGTWTLTRPIQSERLVLTLDADAATGGVTNTDGVPLDGELPTGINPSYPSGNGTPGGDFVLNFNILGGDATGDGVVNALDIADVRRRLGSNSSAGAYNSFSDVFPDGRINALDLAAVRQHLGNRLPSVIIFPPPIDPLPPIDPFPIEPIDPIVLRPVPLEPSPVPIPYPNVTADLFSDGAAIK